MPLRGALYRKVKGIEEPKLKQEIEETIFKTCPVCKTGKAQKLKPVGFLSSLKSHKIICNKCYAQFVEGDEFQNDRTFTLDLSKSDKKNKYDGETLKFSEWERGISDLDFCIKTNTLPKTKVVGLKVILKPNEQTHYCSATELMEERAVRHTYGGRVRVAKGIWVGGARGESHGELRKIDDGSLLLTNMRLIFNGGFRNSEYRLDKINSVEEDEEAVEIGASNRQKVQRFVLNEPKKWATFIRMATQKYQN